MRSALLPGCLILLLACADGGDDRRRGRPDPPPPPPPPPGFVHLEEGYDGEKLLDGLAVPVKMALSPDGRIFFNELVTGNVRVVDPGGTLLAAPFATLTVLTGGEMGLLGLALAPDFPVSGHLFVLHCTPGPDRMQVVRYTDAGSVGTAETVIIDDLPVGLIHNAGDIQFALDGTLFVSVGDTNDPDRAQTDGELAGRVLRYDATGGIPADNPDPASPEWARGLRNTFDLAVHPVTGFLFGSENGPTSEDEINLLLGGKNFEWPSLPPGFPGSRVGFRVIAWTPVIVPTGIAWDGDDLLVCGYDECDIRRLVLSGFHPADLDDEVPFARLEDAGIDNKPLDILVVPDGTVYVSTFTSIWRIWRK